MFDNDHRLSTSIRERDWGRTYPHYSERKWQIISLGIRGPQNVDALLLPRK